MYTRPHRRLNVEGFIVMKLANVNKEILKQFGDIELVKGNGYFYFIGEKVNSLMVSVHVPRLNDLSLAEWLEEAKDRVVAK